MAQNQTPTVRLSKLSTEQWRAGADAVHRWLSHPNAPLPFADQERCAEVILTLTQAATTNGDRIDRVQQAIRQLGETRWQQEVDLMVYGRNENEVGPGQRTRKSTLAEFARKMTTNEIDAPVGFLRTCIENAAKDALGKETVSAAPGSEKPHILRRHATKSDEGSAGDSDNAPVWDTAAHLGARASWAGSLDGLATGVSAISLPVDVSRVFRGSSDLTALMVCLGEAGQGPLTELTARKSATKGARSWQTLQHHLDTHLDAGTRRPRWDVAALEAADNQARSWEALFYQFEGFSDYTDTDEIPGKGAPKRAKFDKHTSRFRGAWWSATTLAAAITDAHGMQSIHGTRVPFSLDPPVHPTLQGRSRRTS